MSRTSRPARIRAVTALVVAATAPLVARAQVASGQVAAGQVSAGQVSASRGIGVDGPGDVAPAWRAGVEVGRVPGLRVGWETLGGPWIFGAAAGLGPGARGVDLRFTPAIRLGRRLSQGFRVDGALGFEFVRLADAGNANETEIQWELTGAWRGASGWAAEAGIRRTDYGRAGWEPLVRLIAPRSLLGDALLMPPSPAGGPDRFGAPRPIAEAGRLGWSVDAPRRRGHGALLAASNPRGDADPWREQVGPNVDRLGLRGEIWSEHGPLAAWARWSSDLHMDPSIAARVAPVAAGAGFPVTVSFSGGARWSDLEQGDEASIVVRHDPKVFFWMPHLGEERTARVRSLSAEAYVGRVAVSGRHGALDPMRGRTLQPLEHTHLALRSRGPWAIGVEHERVAWGGARADVARRERSATRATMSRSAGSLRARVAAGSDIVLRLGVGSGPGAWTAPPPVGPDSTRAPGPSPRTASPWTASPWTAASNWTRASISASPANHTRPAGFWAGADVELRTAPALLDYEALLGRGWMAAGDEVEGKDDRMMASGLVSAGWGPLGAEAAAGHGLPVWTGSSSARSGGGRVDAVLALNQGAIPGHAHVRVRLGEWGPASSWWREEATLEAHLGLPLLVGNAGELGVELHGRSALHGARSGLHERGGVEATIALAVPVPTGPMDAGGRAEARLEDVFDRGLPLRVGAPARGRRLTILLLLVVDRE